MEGEEKLLKMIGVELTAENRDEVMNYLQTLKNYKIESVKKDSKNLLDDLNNLDHKTQEIAFSNYQAFIKTTESSRQVLKGWNETTHNVENLIEKIPNFSTKCDGFVKTSYELNSSLSTVNLTHKKHVELLEILELPQLMEKSIREEKYGHALELASYVQKLNLKLSNVPIVNEVVKTIESSWHVMITQLLMELRCDLTLPKCLQIVGYLRRMQAFSIPELKLKFLQQRDCWLREMLAKVPKNDVYQHLIRTIEVTRVNLFNIITQYKALFDDDFTKDSEKKTNLMLCSWLHGKIEDFLRILETDLSTSNINITDIGSILAQCMYFGASFSRIGVDFRAQLAPIFIRAINKNVSLAIIKGTKQFESDMEGFTLINKEITRSSKKEDEEQSNAPPGSLLDFYPLAVFCNELLTVFNELRICAPFACAPNLISSLESSLESVAKAILAFYRSEQQAFNAKEKENFLKLCSCFTYEFIPFIQSCVVQIFQTQEHALMSAASLENMMRINSEKAIESIEHLLPDKFVPPSPQPIAVMA